ncbi:MAG: type II secretion system protein [Planctomycetota bacterium]
MTGEDARSGNAIPAGMARAFTLIEMVAVLVLIGMLIVFSPMALNTMVAERELEAEVSQLGNTIELIHMQAVLVGAAHAMHYDTENHRYAYQLPETREETTTDPDKKPVEVSILDMDLDPEELEWHQLPRGMKLKMFEGKNELRGRYRVVFTPAGTVDPHTLVVDSDSVSSLNEEDRARTIKVNFPGFVSYAPGRRVEEFKKTESELGR